MNSTNTIILVVVALVVVISGFLYFRGTSTGTSQNQQVADTRAIKTYYDPRYGVAFNFPETYAVQEHDSTAAEGPKHHTIVIGDKNELANAPQNGEGPAVMTIDIYENTAKQTTEKWIKGNNFSNYKLSNDAELSSTTVAGISAYAYPWDGLYRSLSIVFPQGSRMYMMSVGYNAVSDQIYKDFAGVVASVQFD